VNKNKNKEDTDCIALRQKIWEQYWHTDKQPTRGCDESSSDQTLNKLFHQCDKTRIFEVGKTREKNWPLSYLASEKKYCVAEETAFHNCRDSHLREFFRLVVLDKRNEHFDFWMEQQEKQ